jgi:cytochrome c553
MMQFVLRPALALTLCSAAAPSFAAASTPVIPAGARLAANCVACHGPADAAGPIPSLAGQSREAIASSLRAFRDGTRPSTVMTQLAKGYTDQQIEQLAAWFALQKKGG